MADLRKLQLTSFKLLCELDRICRKHNIKYHIAYGTLLGAIRHKGFIPWDDDIDVGMLFEDYKKFCAICETELNTKIFFLQTMETDPYHRYIFAKFRLQNTLYVRKGQEHLKHHHGIFIDIFPLYPVPKNGFLFNIFTRVIATCKTILWSPVGAVSEPNTLLRMKYKIYAKIPKCIPKKIIDCFIALCKNDDFVSSVGDPLYMKFIRLKKDCGKLIEVEFENKMFFAPENYDHLLTSFYGDYMQLPPEEKRQGHHPASKIDFGLY